MFQNLPRIEIYSDEPALRRRPSDLDADVVDYSRNTETGEAETTEVEISHVRPDVTLQKPEAFGKAPSPMFDEPFKYHDELLANQNRYRACCETKRRLPARALLRDARE